MGGLHSLHRPRTRAPRRVRAAQPRARDSSTLCARGGVLQVVNMLSVFYACGKDDPRFERHKARIDDYLWVAEVSRRREGGREPPTQAAHAPPLAHLLG